MTAQITPLAIAARCTTAAGRAIAIEVVGQTGSTNADLLARASGSAPAAALAGPTLLVALVQSAGRGRAGRSWHSDAASLTFSLAWKFRQPITTLVGLPLAVGVVMAEVLAAHGATVSLKWPNDILQDGRKLAGILIETIDASSLLHQESWAVIGIGINLLGASSTAHLTVVQDAVAAPIAALPETDRNSLLGDLLDALGAALPLFAGSGFAPFVARWNALHAHAGREVDIVDHGRTLHAGRALGVDASGRLLLQTPQGPLAVVAGDVSLRVAPEPDHAAAD